MEGILSYQQLQDNDEMQNTTGPGNYHSMDPVANSNNPYNTPSYHGNGDATDVHFRSSASKLKKNETRNDGPTDLSSDNAAIHIGKDEDGSGKSTEPASGSSGPMKEIAGGQTESPTNFTVEEAIDKLGFGWFQIRLTLMDSVLHMTDAGELMLLSYLGPELVCRWNLEHWEKAIISTVVFFGYLVGSPLWGKCADKFGRRKFITGALWELTYYYCYLEHWSGVPCVALMESIRKRIDESPNTYTEVFPPVLTALNLRVLKFPAIGLVLNLTGVCLLYYGILTAFSPTLIWIIVLRGIVGSCIGGVGQVNTLYAEFLPSKVTGFWLTFIGFSWIIGAVYVTAVALFIMPTLGWRYVVIITAVPLLGYIACSFLLPESAHYYAASGNKDAAMATLRKVSEVNKKPLPEGNLIVGVQDDQRGTFRDLFIDKKTSMTTVLLVFVWFSMQFVYYGVILLSTELFAKGNSCAGKEQNATGGCHEACQSLTRADYVSMIWTTLAEFPGIVVTLLIIDVIGRKKTMVVQYIFTGIFIFMLFMCTTRLWLTIYLFVARGMISGALQAVIVYTPEVYPTHVRGIAYGTLKAFGKIGSMVTPFFAQMLLHSSLELTLSVYGGICFAACIFIILLPIETKGRRMLSAVKSVDAGVTGATYA